jgi:hypothetical protein
MTKFTWAAYGQQQEPLQPEGFFQALCGYMKVMFALSREYMRRG